MDTSRFSYLYEQYLNKKLTGDEPQQWKDALSNPDFQHELEVLTQQLWERTDLPVPEYDQNSALAIYNQVIGATGDQVLSGQQPLVAGKQRLLRLWSRTAVAAAVAIVVFGAGLIYYGQQHRSLQTDTIANDIAPGSNKAFLTLANGQRISLTDAANGAIATQSGVKIVKSADGSIDYQIQDQGELSGGFNTTETPKGGQYLVNLADGSKVWLNAASSLKYPASFTNQKTRTVELTGEGYFEIAKDKVHPFIVKTAAQQVEVLGTHFNINAYNDEPFTKTTLLEGRVHVESLAQTKETEILNPGEQAVLVNDHLSVSDANVEEAVAWKDGYFRFNEESMSSIAKKLERWYNVEIELSDKLASKEFTGKIARSRNISRVLSMMEETNRVHFKIEGRRITAIEK
jgi:transmembrane sensor